MTCVVPGGTIKMPLPAAATEKRVPNKKISKLTSVCHWHNTIGTPIYIVVSLWFTAQQSARTVSGVDRVDEEEERRIAGILGRNL